MLHCRISIKSMLRRRNLERKFAREALRTRVGEG